MSANRSVAAKTLLIVFISNLYPFYIIMSSPTKKIPATIGGFIPQLADSANFQRWHSVFNEKIADINLYRFNYNYKPLLIYFYEKEWGSLGNCHLDQLNNSLTRLKLQGCNLLIVTATSFEDLNVISWKKGWSLSSFEDSNNELAASLNIYSDESPSWNTYSGIDTNIALPALYLLDHSRQVAFSFPNNDLAEQLPLSQVSNILVHLNLYKPDQQSA